MHVQPHAGAVAGAPRHLPVAVNPAESQHVLPDIVGKAHGHIAGGGGTQGGGGGDDEQVFGGSGTMATTSPALHLPDAVTGPGLQHLDPDFVGWGHMHCGAGMAVQVPLPSSAYGQHVLPDLLGNGQL